MVYYMYIFLNLSRKLSSNIRYLYCHAYYCSLLTISFSYNRHLINLSLERLFGLKSRSLNHQVCMLNSSFLHYRADNNRWKYIYSLTIRELIVHPQDSRQSYEINTDVPLYLHGWQFLKTEIIGAQDSVSLFPWVEPCSNRLESWCLMKQQPQLIQQQIILSRRLSGQSLGIAQSVPLLIVSLLLLTVIWFWCSVMVCIVIPYMHSLNMINIIQEGQYIVLELSITKLE